MDRAQLGRLFTVIGRFLLRSPVALAVCCGCLVVGLTQVTLVYAIKASLDDQLATGELAGVYIVFRNGITNEIASNLDTDEVENLRALCAARDCSFSPQLLTTVAVPGLGNGKGAELTVRGVESLQSIPGVRLDLVQGRFPQPGLDEVVAGEDALSAAKRAIGETLRIREKRFVIVGSFRSDGAPFNGDVLVRSDQLHSLGLSGWSTVWVGSRSGKDNPLPPEVVEPVLKKAVTVTPGRTLFMNQFGRTRSTVQRIVVSITLLVSAFTVAAYVSGMLNVVRRASHALKVLHNIGFRRSTILAALGLNGAMVGLAAGIAAAVIARFFADGMIVTLPTGLKKLSVPIGISTADVIACVLFSMLMGAVGAVLAGRGAFAPKR